MGAGRGISQEAAQTHLLRSVPTCFTGDVCPLFCSFSYTCSQLKKSHALNFFFIFIFFTPSGLSNFAESILSQCVDLDVLNN